MAKQRDKLIADMKTKDEKNPETGFLQNWSRRKLDAQTETREILNNDLELTTVSDAMSSQVTTSEMTEFKTDEDMTPIEQLNEESNYCDFLSPNVSDALRKQALRKLFHMPHLNIIDGLDDYAEDYTSFAALGDIIPHEMKRMLEREKEKALAEAKETEAKETEAKELAEKHEKSTLNNDSDPDDELDAEIESAELEHEDNDNLSLLHTNDLQT